ncbi:MAG: helix-turn-helix domain-containing protein [Hyphomonas sp.]
MENAQPSPYLLAAEAAAYLRLEERTINNMRWRGEGPSYRKHGGKVIYHRDDLDAWSRTRDAGSGHNTDGQDKDDD